MKDQAATADSDLIPSREASEVAGSGGGQNNVLTIARRELRSYFDSLVAYVVIGGSLLGVGLYFFLFRGGFWQVDRVTMQLMFDAMPFALVTLVIPLVTMRSLAEEKRQGTIELLITLPVTDADVILGKYFAALAMIVILFLATLVYPIAMFLWPWHLGALDWGPVWAGYLGLFLYSTAGTSIGLLYSSITESQIIAFFLTAFTLGFIHLLGTFVEYLPGVLGDAVSFLSFAARYQPFERGLIDTRAIVYFLSVAIICLLAAFRSLESRKWS
jgi:ABC-2 type transport system permease protein